MSITVRQSSSDIRAEPVAGEARVVDEVGYVLDEQGEEKRRHSLAEQRRNSLARKRSGSLSHDVEKQAGLQNASSPDQTGAGEEETGESSEDEANIVFWDGPDDPANPYNWPSWKKVVNCVLISALTFITPLGSSIFAPGVPELMRDFQSSSSELAAFVVSVYVLGFAFGPMLMAPLSEIYGRLIVYHICNVAFFAFLSLFTSLAMSCFLFPRSNQYWKTY